MSCAQAFCTTILGILHERACMEELCVFRRTLVVVAKSTIKSDGSYIHSSSFLYSWLKWSSIPMQIDEKKGNE